MSSEKIDLKRKHEMDYVSTVKDLAKAFNRLIEHKQFSAVYAANAVIHAQVVRIGMFIGIMTDMRDEVITNSPELDQYVSGLLKDMNKEIEENDVLDNNSYPREVMYLLHKIEVLCGRAAIIGMKVASELISISATERKVSRWVSFPAYAVHEGRYLRTLAEAEASRNLALMKHAGNSDEVPGNIEDNSFKVRTLFMAIYATTNHKQELLSEEFKKVVIPFISTLKENEVVSIRWKCNKTKEDIHLDELLNVFNGKAKEVINAEEYIQDWELLLISDHFSGKAKLQKEYF